MPRRSIKTNQRLMVKRKNSPYNTDTVIFLFSTLTKARGEACRTIVPSVQTLQSEVMHYLNRKYISAAVPLEDYVLQVDFVSGSRLLLDMKPYLDRLRFKPLADPAVWQSAETNGIFVRFGSVKLSHDELLSMAERDM